MKGKKLAEIIKALQLGQQRRLDGEVEGDCILRIKETGKHIFPTSYKCVNCQRKDYNNCDTYKKVILIVK